ncbi:ABC transporter substrate-binding protein/permease [Paludisphaera borealis]|uniref:L-cystine transport system permease protein YecS n=1 Tax=Paludisphaera borealis TaxID=1387353 RepID=A0A1U7CU07_9BACT|nr:ABC transporter substrate-binding protein/permease [Paludisphaera borealis]APW62424.1 L-cystine transport system permease protein YecS [Paludisphaera borealis]
MEEDSDASESDADSSAPSDSPPRAFARSPLCAPTFSRLFLTGLALITLLGPCVRGDALDDVRARGRLRYGSDMEGGGPYAFPDPRTPRDVTGFEVEMMHLLARDLGATAEFSQGQWDKLLPVLDSNRIDVVVNGYEWTDVRLRDHLATRPYYIYQLQLMGRKGGEIRSWADLKRIRHKGRRWTVGVLVGSAADVFADEQAGDSIQVVRFDGATDAMLAVQNGQYDFTLQDQPAALFYRDRFPGLELVGPPESHGYYVIYTRKEDARLRDALDESLGRLIASGELRRIDEKYGIWTEAQTELASFDGPIAAVSGLRIAGGWELLSRYRARLLDAAVVTLGLSFGSMPLAMALGLAIALGRLYGPKSLRALLGGYVELIRGTPLMLQLFVLFYLLRLPPWVAGIGGLAINYSAYEAEIYRAGLQAVPPGQMEAALALGMSRRMALRRVIVPQAVRIVIPPVTNDFIALFKDTSVCSVITLVELTKQYSILANSTGGAIEFALATAFLYMMMSVPLSWFSRWSEARLASGGPKGGAS